MPSNAIARSEIAEAIVARLTQELDRMRADFRAPDRISAAWIDDLLPASIARAIFDQMPPPARMVEKRSVKELKFFSAQMDKHDPLLEETVYAFQDPRVVTLIADVTGIKGIEPDPELYAGGISLMAKGGYLRPHIDNSHDRNRSRYRVLNLLYYVTPDWRADYGGSLQLWDNGPLSEPRTIPSLFNRLVLMATDKTSWHSVNEIRHDGHRCCVSNYYFSQEAPSDKEYFHSTSFRGEKAGIADMFMQADNLARTAVLKVFPAFIKIRTDIGGNQKIRPLPCRMRLSPLSRTPVQANNRVVYKVSRGQKYG